MIRYNTKLTSTRSGLAKPLRPRNPSESADQEPLHAREKWSVQVFMTLWTPLFRYFWENGEGTQCRLVSRRGSQCDFVEIMNTDPPFTAGWLIIL